jgi:hypothetical protein
MVSSNNNDENNKFIEHLNEVLSAENAAIERLERRIQETPIQDSKKYITTAFTRGKRTTKKIERSNLCLW